MSQRLEAAEALLATIATARARMSHLAHTHLSFDKVLALELADRVGHSPERVQIELLEDIVDRRVDSWRRARAAVVAQYVESPTLAPLLTHVVVAEDPSLTKEEAIELEEQLAAEAPHEAPEAEEEEALPSEAPEPEGEDSEDVALEAAPSEEDEAEEEDEAAEGEEAAAEEPSSEDEAPPTPGGGLAALEQGYGTTVAGLAEAGIAGEEPTVIAEVPPEIAALRRQVLEEDDDDSSSGGLDLAWEPGPDFDDANDEPSDRFDSGGIEPFEADDVDALESLTTGDHEALGAPGDFKAWPDDEDTDQGPLTVDSDLAEELLSADLAPLEENDLDAVEPEALEDEVLDPAAAEDPSIEPLDESSLQPLTEPEDEATAIASADEIEAALRGAMSQPHSDTSTAGVSAPRSVSPSMGAPRVQLGGPRAVAPAGSQGPVVVEPESDFGEQRPAAASIQLLGDGKARVLTDTLALGGAGDEGDEESDPNEPEVEGSSFSVSLEAPEEAPAADEVHVPVLSEGDEDAALSSVLHEAENPRAEGQNQVDLTEFRKRAAAAEGRGDLQEAITHYSDLLDLDPDLTESYLARGRCLLELGDYAASMSDFQRAEDLAPDSADPLLEMGNLFYARKDYARAIHYYDQAIELDPTHAMARCRRGICYYHRKEYEPALADLQRAYSLDPDIHNIGRYVQMAVKAMRRTGR